MSHDDSDAAQKYDSWMRPASTDERGLAWYRPFEPPFSLCGFPFFTTDRVYRRLPLDPPRKLPESVDALAWHTAGGQIRFRSDSPACSVKVALREKVSMGHMALVGQSGFDGYIGAPGKMRFAGAATSDPQSTSYTCEIFTCPSRTMRDVTLNFPLYNGVTEVMVGLAAGCAVEEPSSLCTERPVVVYGTSITQGGCASRPGMAYTNILSRRMQAPFVNLGFSGSGRAEHAVADCIARIPEPLGIVIDCDANYSDEEMAERLPGFVDIIRARFPASPVLILSRTPFGKDNFDTVSRTHRGKRAAWHRDLAAKRNADGDSLVYFLSGEELLGIDWDECTVDGVHPTDLGFMRIADSLEPVLRHILDL